MRLSIFCLQTKRSVGRGIQAKNNFLLRKALWTARASQAVSVKLVHGTMESLKDFIKQIKSKRQETGTAEEYKFDERRCKLLSTCEDVKEDAKSVVYWMQRDCRVQDNWALVFAQRMAYRAQLPLHVLFFCEPIKEYYPTMRQYKFLIDGLQQVSRELNELKVRFFLVNGTARDRLPEVVKANDVGAVVCEFNPLRRHMQDIELLSEELPDDVPFIEVDAHNVVPCRVASPKQEIAARTIRPKLKDEYLVEFPEVTEHVFYKDALKVNAVPFKDVLSVNAKFFENDPPLQEIEWAKPGTEEGVKILHVFIRDKLKNYHSGRNEPSQDGQSNLSPWLHFGQVSAQRCALEAKKARRDDNVHAFLDELIVRRELSDNFCYYNKNYDKFEGADKWARETLKLHWKDKRPYLYTLDQLSSARTHDPCWNAAQEQLNKEGKMHGYMRMYWAKKVLEWTADPEQAIEFALHLNDTYSLDGSDPNGFVGVMWSVCGVHDHGWKERAVFGKIRYMVDYSLRKKYDMDAYCAKYCVSEPPSKKKKKK